MDIYVPDSNKVVHETSVDFIRRTLPNPVHVVQYDTEMPVVAVSLFRNGQTYTVIDGSTINIRFGKPDSTFVIKEVLGKNAAGNIVYFDVDPQMTIFHGTFHPIIEVIIDEQVAGSSALNLEIDRNPVQDSYVESTPEYHKLDEALEKADEILEELDTLMTNPMTSAGDIVIGGTDGDPTRLSAGSEGQVLKIVSGTPAWGTGGSGMTNPMTAQGDIIVGGSSGTPDRLAKGSAGQALIMNGAGTLPEWKTLPTEIFKCTYGTTTYNEITSALSDGKLPVCFYNNIEYIYVGLSNTSRYTFSSQLFDTNRYVSVNSSNSWAGGSNNFEITNNKVTSISSSSTDTQYPSAKCVYNNLELKMSNPMTTAGDIIVGGSSGTPARLGIGTANQFLCVNSAGTGIEWRTIQNANGNSF